jgi:hypothetical protein
VENLCMPRAKPVDNLTTQKNFAGATPGDAACPIGVDGAFAIRFA